MRGFRYFSFLETATLMSFHSKKRRLIIFVIQSQMTFNLINMKINGARRGSVFVLSGVINVTYITCLIGIYYIKSQVADRLGVLQSLRFSQMNLKYFLLYKHNVKADKYNDGLRSKLVTENIIFPQ